MTFWLNHSKIPHRLFLKVISLFKGRRKGCNSWPALAAAYLLVIQTLILGFAQTTHASVVQRDFLGNVICSSELNKAGQDEPGQPSNHLHRQNCCVLGCKMFGPSVAPPPTIISFVQFRSAEANAEVNLSDKYFIICKQRTPRNTRAPPPAS